MRIKFEDWLAHYGTPRKSGRYPWGFGTADEKIYEGSFLDITRKLRREGMSNKSIAEGFGINTSELRARQSIESNERRLEKETAVKKLATKGMGASEIGRNLGLSESSVRSTIASMQKDRSANIHTIAGVLKDDVDKHGFIQIGSGVEHQLGITSTKLGHAVAVLKEDGYRVHPVQVPQVGGAAGQKTTVKVLTRPGTTYRDAVANADNIRMVSSHSKDGGRTFEPDFKPPINIDPKRILVKYKEDGGADADGTLFVRPGVPDVSIGGKNYAQVRVAVGGSHYMKGMAVYKDDLPPGVDIQYNTNKSKADGPLNAMKPMKRLNGDDPNSPVDQENPFGSQVRRQILGPDGKPSSAMNILNEEGSWKEWSNSISSQVLSKQSPLLAKQQLDLKRERAREDLDEIMSLTNPIVRKHLLEKFADGADSSAVHLEAANLPRQSTHAILPVKSLKPTEVYAPNYDDGETVVLIRFPHGGKFEIPELQVNNRNREAIKMMGKSAIDAVGIHPKVAETLSGADFDGDFVLVIPNKPNSPRGIRTEPALKALKNFDPHTQYKLPDDVPRMKPKTKGLEMGNISNLITDMTIKGATNDELARAVKHSMVVIDAEKHHLDYKRSAKDHAIAALKTRYQGGADKGASTLISRATSTTRVDETKDRSPKDGGPIDPKTGRKMTVVKGYTNRDGQFVVRKVDAEKLAVTDDAHSLVSKERTAIEVVYADHSNGLKSLANEARKEVAKYKPTRMDPNAKRAYKAEVDSLVSKLKIARANAPLERQAQIFANIIVAKQKEAKPTMDNAELKKLKGQALATARVRVGASKTKIVPTPGEWAAIQAGAVSPNQLKQMLENADLKAVRQLATPRTTVAMTPTKIARAQSMANRGYNQAEIARALGVSTSTVRGALS